MVFGPESVPFHAWLPYPLGPGWSMCCGGTFTAEDQFKQMTFNLLTDEENYANKDIHSYNSIALQIAFKE